MELNTTYTIRILVNGHLLTYTGRVISIDDPFITIFDVYGKKVSLNKNTIQNYEEVQNEN